MTTEKLELNKFLIVDFFSWRKIYLIVSHVVGTSPWRFGIVWGWYEVTGCRLSRFRFRDGRFLNDRLRFFPTVPQRRCLQSSIGRRFMQFSIPVHFTSMVLYLVGELSNNF